MDAKEPELGRMEKNTGTTKQAPFTNELKKCPYNFGLYMRICYQKLELLFSFFVFCGEGKILPFIK